jgi:hypothetical protein
MYIENEAVRERIAELARTAVQLTDALAHVAYGAE